MPADGSKMIADLIMLMISSFGFSAMIDDQKPQLESID
jgi:hypothetical protein